MNKNAILKPIALYANPKINFEKYKNQKASKCLTEFPKQLERSTLYKTVSGNILFKQGGTYTDISTTTL